MRSTSLLLAVAFAVVACGRRSEHRDTAAVGAPGAVASAQVSGPDEIVVRFPRAGGTAHAFPFPALDTAVWTSSSKVPALARVLAFDDGAGSIAAEDAKGAPVRVDLRMGTVNRESGTKLTALASADGAAIYGIAPDGAVRRLTPTGTWTFKPPVPAEEVLPQPDGSIVVIGKTSAGPTAWLMHPPDNTLADTAVLPNDAHPVRTPAADRVYFVAGGDVLGLRVRDLSAVPAVVLPARVRAVTTTPSGDRVYAALDSSPDLLVIDRYTQKVAAKLVLPTPALALRMDPSGRFVLARAQGTDSAFVIAVGTDALLGAVPTEWRPDLPVVTPNGWIATAQGKDVVMVDGATLAPKRTIRGGAADTWLFVGWNGFRPRAAGLDQPVTFDTPYTTGDSARDTTTATVSATAQLAHDSSGIDTTTHPTAHRDTTRVTPRGFTVQFAALRKRAPAEELVGSIHLPATPARVVVTSRDGIPIYRVVAGPFATRDEAERVARSSGHPYWVYEGPPE